MNWDENLPDPGKWQPESGKQDTLRNSLMLTCQFAQRRIIARAKAEIDFNINNFDSGSGIEEIVREELSNILPRRYSVDAGVVNDCGGNTAGDCDMLVRDPVWSPVIKPGATIRSRRFHYPIEGIYAAAEIKQTLGYEQLDEAMEKLVKISRLNRKENSYGHITENQHISNFDSPGVILNPLHTTIIATKLNDTTTFCEIANRFGAINASLGRSHMVTMLCVLGHGAAWYSVESGNPYNADYMRDRNQPLVLQFNDGEPDNVFYRWYVLLMMHLNRSVLSLIGVSNNYGSSPPNRTVKPYPDAEFNKVSDEPR